MRFKHVSLIMCGSLLLTGAGAGGAILSQHRSRPPHPDKLTTAQAERGALRQSISSTGKVVANLDVEIKCKASGEVIRLPFDVSDCVKKGDLLLQIDPADATRDLKQAEASLSASKARLAIAQKNLKLAEDSLVTDRQHAEA